MVAEARARMPAARATTAQRLSALLKEVTRGPVRRSAAWLWRPAVMKGE